MAAQGLTLEFPAVRDRDGGEARRLLRRFGIRVEGVDTWRFGRAESANDVSRVLAEPTELWMSRFRPTDKRLVFVERPIDALSYEQAIGGRQSCYMAVGALLPRQRRMVGHVLRELPAGVTVVLAFGGDEHGEHLAQQVGALARGLPVVRHSPDDGGSWNDHVRTRECGRAALVA
jgi:Toprim-like